MGKIEFESSKAAGGVHHRLGSLAGEWEGTNRTWFEPGKLADESAIRGSIRAVLGGRFLMHEYRSTLAGEPLEGIAIYGYHLDARRYECAWVDSTHMGTAIMLSVGEAGDARTRVLGSYGEPGAGQPWGWRTQIELTDPDHLVITAYNISPTGEEAKAVETRYTRTR